MSGHVEAEHRRRPDAALVADQTAQRPGHRPGNPCDPALEPEALGKSSQAHHAGKDQQPTDEKKRNKAEENVDPGSQGAGRFIL